MLASAGHVGLANCTAGSRAGYTCSTIVANPLLLKTDSQLIVLWYLVQFYT